MSGRGAGGAKFATPERHHPSQPFPSFQGPEPKMPKPLTKRRFDEVDIKASVLNELRSQGRIDRRTPIANEFCLGRTGVRVDLMLWSDELIGIEVKSELDSLRRLAGQLSAYTAYCDHTVLVVASRHLSQLAAVELG